VSLALLGGLSPELERGSGSVGLHLLRCDDCLVAFFQEMTPLAFSAALSDAWLLPLKEMTPLSRLHCRSPRRCHLLREGSSFSRDEAALLLAL
jgi:hypothetical protein